MKFEVVLRSNHQFGTHASHIHELFKFISSRMNHGLVYGLVYYSKCICLVKWQLFVIIDAFIVIMEIMDA